MASYNPFYNQNNTGENSAESRNFLNKYLRRINSVGMNYSDMIIKNKVATSKHEDPTISLMGNVQDVYAHTVLMKLSSSISIPYTDRAYVEKRKMLREYSLKDKIKRLNKMQIFQNLSDKITVKYILTFASYMSLNEAKEKVIEKEREALRKDAKEYLLNKIKK